ncbi:MAG: AAA family ATPase [Oscillospiraceae bacterium]|nr:AAA family ATPase [Oscillospiraceae bacterium]
MANRKDNTIKLRSAVLEDFKSVDHGRIDIEPNENGGADILGIYGQNGSGKTAFIEAMAIVKHLMSGAAVPNVYSDCVSSVTGESRVSLTYGIEHDEELSYLDYSFKMRRVEENEVDRVNYSGLFLGGDVKTASDGFKLEIYDEKLSLREDEDGEPLILRDVSEGVNKFNLDGRSAYMDIKNELIIDFEVNKRLIREKSASFLFSSYLTENAKGTVKLNWALDALVDYARNNFFVVDTKSTGYVQLNYSLPIYTRHGVYFFKSYEPTFIADGIFEYISGQIKGISEVLSQMVPGLGIGINVAATTTDSNGVSGKRIELVSLRDGIQLPLRYESDGVRKIISELAYIIAVYNEEGFTVAVDEFDSGVFEFLLGELLETLADSGRGQLIFTSHNLRPLEVVDSSYICFTTTDPKNRYIKIAKEDGENFRSGYFRKIMLDTGVQKMYSRTKKHKIMAAMSHAGGEERDD